MSSPAFNPTLNPAGPSLIADLSVIIVTYNSRELTLACVRSVLADAVSVPGAVEVIIVDNGSTDGTAEALAELGPGGETTAVRVVRSASNQGFARGNNLGLAAAAGRYLMLLNSDTEVQPGALGALVTFMEAHPEAGACGPMLLNSDGSLQPSGRNLPTLGSVLLDMTKLHRLARRNLYAQRGRDYSQAAQVGELSAAALLVRRAVYARVGGLDPAFFAYYEDVDWCKRIGDAGYAIWYVPEAKVLHHWGGTSRSVSTLAYQAGQDSLRYYFRKHHGPRQAVAVQAMLAGKETLLWAVGAVRGRAEARALHAGMLRRALRPLPVQP